MMSYLVNTAKSLTSKHLHRQTEAGLEVDEWTEVINNLTTLTERYAEEKECSDSD